MSVLNWDMETHMPKNGHKFRAQQLSTLTKIAYDLATDNKYGTLLEKLLVDDSLNNDQKRNVYLSNKAFLKTQKYSGEFIQRESNLISKAFKSPSDRFVFIIIRLSQFSSHLSDHSTLDSFVSYNSTDS